MAEEQKQDKDIGELFVEFGVKGLPTLLKGLNSVSASFLLTKNAAEQFTKPIINTGKQAANSAVGVSKLSSSLGTTYLEAQKLQLYFQKHNLSESLLGDLGSTADMLTKVQMGIGGISGEFAYAMHRMGLSWTDYDGSIESMEKLMHDVNNATKTMNPRERRIMLQSIGWSPEMGYAFDRGINLKDALTLPDDVINNLVETTEAVNEAGQAIKKLKDTVIGKSAPVIIPAAAKLTEKVEKASTNDPVAKAQLLNLGAGIGAGTIIGGTLGGIWGASLGPAGAFLGAGFGASVGTTLTTGGGIGAILAGDKIKEKMVGQPTGGAAPIAPPFMQNTVQTPPNLNTSNTTIQVSNENHIHVANPQDVGTAISSINRDTMRNIEYNEFQTANRPGL